MKSWRYLRAGRGRASPAAGCARATAALPHAAARGVLQRIPCEPLPGNRAEGPAHVASVSGSGAGPSEEAGPTSPAAAWATAALLRTAAREPCSVVVAAVAGAVARAVVVRAGVRRRVGTVAVAGAVAVSAVGAVGTVGRRRVQDIWKGVPRAWRLQVGDVQFCGRCKGTTPHVWVQGGDVRFFAGCKGTTSHFWPVARGRRPMFFDTGPHFVKPCSSSRTSRSSTGSRTRTRRGRGTAFSHGAEESERKAKRATCRNAGLQCRRARSAAL